MNATVPLFPCLVFRPSVLKSKRDRKTRLFPLNAAPVVREGRLISDNTMPDRRWSDLDSPACERIPARSVCAAQFTQETNNGSANHQGN